MAISFKPCSKQLVTKPLLRECPPYSGVISQGARPAFDDVRYRRWVQSPGEGLRSEGGSEQRTGGATAFFEPGFDRTDRAGFRMLTSGDGDQSPLPQAVLFLVADLDQQSALLYRYVRQVQATEAAAAQCGGEAQGKNSPI